jgi:uncharacterized membrane protein
VQNRPLFLYWTLFHYMFLPNRPSSGVQVVVVKDSTAHCNAVIFAPIVVASGYFGYVGCHPFYLGVPQRTTMMADQHTT